MSLNEHALGHGESHRRVDGALLEVQALNFVADLGILVTQLMFVVS